jgi:pyruvate/2-oxoglutarate dehydrogenase complex dihydrolipoamide dehydrogenase (E3) component
VERYDLVVIGGGAAGINAVKAAVALKARVALVDRGPLGGTCVNRG